MATKTFTTGEVLTAADTNTYLANSGLVFIKSQTIGSAVSTVTVSDAFNASYNAFRIVIDGGTSSATTNVRMTLGASVTGYYWSLVYAAYAAATPLALVGNNATLMTYAGTASTNGITMCMDVIDPNTTKHTKFHSFFPSPTESGPFSGVHQVATAYTDFVISPNSGTLTGGTITVYGYRKA